MVVLFVDPGALRSEVSLEACTTESDELGGFTESWAETASLFARIEPVSATSIFGAGQTLETITHTVTLRHRDGVASGMRFRKGSRIFGIITVHDPDETGRYLVCRAKEVGA